MERLVQWTAKLSSLLIQGRTGRFGQGSSFEQNNGVPLFRKLAITPTLVLGVITTAGLTTALLIGPALAPYNPYLRTQRVVEHFDADAGVMVRPPLPPSPEYPLGTDPWGRDTLSLLLFGARNTLIAASGITATRVLLGLILGIAAGWNEGSTFDRIMMACTGILSSLPILISSMILIFGVGIQRGFTSFFIALTLVGWTEIAQYIRSEMIVIRERAYVEGARALGMDELTVIIRHALPNITPQVVVLTFLEYGAVMILIGELAFVGLFIGGGSRIATDLGLGEVEFDSIANIPEWGAMLATGFRYLRSAPFVIVPPALSFFLATIGFNALGEGLRSLFEESGIGTAFLLRRGTALGVAAAILAGVFLMNQTGPSPWYSRLARNFDGQAAYRIAGDLTEMEGRGLGQTGSQQAVDYIVERFQEVGLQPAGRMASFTIDQPALVLQPLDQPTLKIGTEDGSSDLEYQHLVDFGYRVGDGAIDGNAVGPLTLITFPDGTRPLADAEYKGLDLRDQIVVVLDKRHPARFLDQAIIRGARAVITILPDDLSYPSSQRVVPMRGEQAADGRFPARGVPVFSLRPSAFQQALELISLQLPELLGEETDPDYGSEGWRRVDLPLVASLSLRLDDPIPINVPSVVGYLPGTDANVADRLIVVAARYDGLGLDPDGTVYPGAVTGATGIGVMLELARSWQNQQFSPARSVLFLAWAGGVDGVSGAEDYLDDPGNFVYLQTATITRAPLPTDVFFIGRLGAGADMLEAQPIGAGLGVLAMQLATSARQAGVPLTVITSDAVPPGDDLSTSAVDGVLLQRTASAIRPDQDRLARIAPDLLEQTGRMLSLTIIHVAAGQGG